MNEVWKTIDECKDYQVSNLGRVKSLKYGREKILQQAIDDKGYKRVLLSMNNKHKSRQVHRLVAKAFIPNINNYAEVNHIDENPQNNNSSNLEWCTKQYNLKYGTGMIRSQLSQHRKKVNQYDLQGNYIRTHNSVNDAARFINKPKDATSITKCCKGSNKTAHKYIWKYHKD